MTQRNEIVCPNCFRISQPGARFCAACGTQLDLPRCQTCNAVLDPGAKFCRYCGAPVARRTHRQRAPVGRWPGYVVVGITIVIYLSALLLAWMGAAFSFGWGIAFGVVSGLVVLAWLVWRLNLSHRLRRTTRRAADPSVPNGELASLVAPTTHATVPQPRLRNVQFGAIAGVLLVCAIVTVYLARSVDRAGLTYHINGVGMEPGLADNGMVLVNTASSTKDHLERGNIVVFNAPDAGKAVQIKRIVGLPGEQLEIRSGHVLVNGKQLTENYLQAAQTDCPASDICRVEIPADAVFVLGDNRGNSADSRSFGPVPLANIHGRVQLVFWPIEHLGWLGRAP